MATNGRSTNLATATQWTMPFLIPILIGVGTFFTLQADIRHLENRVAKDETVVLRDVTDLETRLRSVEIEAASRLANIETRLVNIEGYMREISIALKSSRFDQ